MAGLLFAGRYVALQQLGSGGMGDVWLARDQQGGAHVTVKVLKASLVGTDEARTRFFREAYTAASLDHPHVARVFEVGALPTGEPFLVMEYVEGGDLSTLLEQRGGALPVGEAVAYVAQAAAGVAAAHAAGVVHRDIKPSNLMLTRRPDGGALVKVLDFGVARAGKGMKGLTQAGVFVGSPQYTAPEQLEGAEIDARADVWALGATLYRLLSGRLPFEAGELGELLVAMATTRPAPIGRADVAPALEQVVLSCLEVDAARRPHDASALLSLLAPFVPPWGAPVAATTVVAPLAVAPMKGAEKAVGGPGLGARLGAALMGATFWVVLVVVVGLGGLVGACAWIYSVAIPSEEQNDADVPLSVPDPRNADIVQLGVQALAIARRFDKGAEVMAFSSEHVTPRATIDVSRSSSAAIFTMRLPSSNRVMFIRVGAGHMLARRSFLPPSSGRPPWPPTCSLAAALRAGNGAGASSAKADLQSVRYDAEPTGSRPPVWKVGSVGVVKLDGATCSVLSR